MDENKPIEQRLTENVGNLTENQDKMMEFTKNNDYWSMILFLFYLDDAQKKDEQWEQFEQRCIRRECRFQVLRSSVADSKVHDGKNRPIRVYKNIDSRFILEDFYAKLQLFSREE